MGWSGGGRGWFVARLGAVGDVGTGGWGPVWGGGFRSGEGGGKDVSERRIEVIMKM